jgi:hypothetical protein
MESYLLLQLAYYVRSEGAPIAYYSNQKIIHLCAFIIVYSGYYRRFQTSQEAVTIEHVTVGYDIL